MYKELLGEELNKQVKEALKDKPKTLLIEDTKNPAYIPKSRFDEVIGQRNELKSQVGELTGQLDGLKKSAKDPEKLKAEIEDIKKQYLDLEEKHKSSSIESAIKLKAVQEKAKDPSDILSFVEKSKLQFDKDGNITGLDEQIKLLKEKKSYLFDSGEPQKPPVPASSGSNPQTAKFKGELGQLQDALKVAMDRRDTVSQIQIQNKIFELQKG